MEMTLEAVRKNLEYLEHHGVKGQRWGVRRTPEQLGHILEKKNARHYGRYNKAVKKISKIQGEKTIDQLTAKERAKIQKAIGSAEKQLSKMTSTEEKYGKKIHKAETKQAKAEEKAALKEAAEKEKIEAKKAKLLKKQDWQGIMDNKKLFTEKELTDATNKLNAEKRMREALETNSMDKAAKKLKSTANLVGSGVELYNKVKDIQGIYESGKREKAYKEIRQLMADGNNAEVIKKSVGIGDKDVEVFKKRYDFLNALNKDLKTDEKKVAPWVDDYVTEKKQKTVFDDFMEGIASKSKTSGNEEPLKGAVEGLGNSFRRENQNRPGSDIVDVYEDYLPLAINNIGGFKLSDFKK